MISPKEFEKLKQRKLLEGKISYHNRVTVEAQDLVNKVFESIKDGRDELDISRPWYNSDVRRHKDVERVTNLTLLSGGFYIARKQQTSNYIWYRIGTVPKWLSRIFDWLRKRELEAFKRLQDVEID